MTNSQRLRNQIDSMQRELGLPDTSSHGLYQITHQYLGRKI